MTPIYTYIHLYLYLCVINLQGMFMFCSVFTWIFLRWWNYLDCMNFLCKLQRSWLSDFGVSNSGNFYKNTFFFSLFDQCLACTDPIFTGITSLWCSIFCFLSYHFKFFEENIVCYLFFFSFQNFHLKQFIKRTVRKKNLQIAL